MEYMTIKDAAEKWGITQRRIQVLCVEGRIEGAVRFGKAWAIPIDTEKPSDARIKSGKYAKQDIKEKKVGVDNQKVKIFSFFSGSGFLDLGFEKVGFQIELVNERQPNFMAAYKYARERMEIKPPKYGYYNIDINEFLKPRQEELQDNLSDAKKDGSLVGFIGGPPCPDFSVAGKNKGKEGVNGKLSSSYIELIANMKPDFFLFENVKGLWRTARHREYFEELKKVLHDAGYVMTERLTNALEYAAPQDRDRILLFGIREDVLIGLGRKDISGFPWGKYQKYKLDEVKQMHWPDTKEFRVEEEIQCPKDVPEELTVEYWFRKNDVENHPNAQDYFIPRAGLIRMQTIEEGDVSKKSYKRLHRWRYSPTVAYGNNEVHLHPYKERRLSAAEAMALQTLPREFELPTDMSLTDKFKTIGNGVPFLLANGIAKTIDDFLRG